ncbi:mannose-specific PTS system EIIAB component [Escherichia coli]|uniref:Mannose-specific PTS system EIIAB component n=1 Tax=Escherichia coli TaxID=562 RepID=A0A377D5F8_ECOLX|nr:mannose-specific PTS system EIIAB component [Escherichia coli]
MPETLIEKYNAQLAKLDTTKGVLFLVDTWGGSPFNAASRIVVDKEHYEVIAGVNIPMLVETLMAVMMTQALMNWWRWQ